MKFDRTNGKNAVYIVTLYGETVADYYYYHYLKDAKNLFNRLKEGNHEKGTIISIYDLINDTRKEFFKA